MPLYEYACPTCKDRFEVLQRLGAGSEELVCPGCGGGELQRQHSTFAAAGGSAACAPGGRFT